MIALPKPRTSWDYELEDELAALRAHREEREIPAKATSRLLMATWNIANLGVQKRREQDLRLIAEMLGCSI